MANKIKIGDYEFTKMHESQNEHYVIKDGKMFCDDKFVACCEGCYAITYKHGVLVIANENVNKKCDDGSTSYTFYNNSGKSIFYMQNYDVISTNPSTIIHEVNTDIRVRLFEELMVVEVFDGQHYAVKSIDYTTGKGFCADSVEDACANAMLFKQEQEEKDLQI